MRISGLAVAFFISLFAGIAIGGPIHTWVAGEYIDASRLNAALQHLHANLGHGHGPVLVNGDINGSAAIAHSKLATPGLLPKAWVALSAACATSGAGAACTAVDSSGSAVVTSTGTTDGEYTVTFPTRGDANYGVLVSTLGTSLDRLCHAHALTATTATVKCSTLDGTTAVDAAFTFMLLDSSN